MQISIHTPVKGVTGIYRVFDPSTGISIHTPVKGVTGEPLRSPPEKQKISIHTPVKGVTLRHSEGLRASPISIHTPVKGVTDTRGGDDPPRRISIHTPVKGVTERSASKWGRWIDFNPHTREGCDLDLGLVEFPGLEFQSTHP